MDATLQRELARAAGEDWAAEYDYHLGQVEHPLPFGLFRNKKHLLDLLLRRDPAGRDQTLDGRINSLCAELGY